MPKANSRVSTLNQHGILREPKNSTQDSHNAESSYHIGTFIKLILEPKYDRDTQGTHSNSLNPDSINDMHFGVSRQVHF